MHRLIKPCLIVATALAALASGRAGAQTLVPASPGPLPLTGGSTVISGAPADPAPACPGGAAPAPRPFTPFMLGDFTGPIGSLFLDLKIAEGQSPRPIDRVYFNFNGYANLNKDQFDNPIQPVHNINLYRWVFGFEKTFMDGTVSLGVRVPFYTITAEGRDFTVVPTPLGPAIGPGDAGQSTTHFGNVSAILKAILWEDRQTGSLLSAGATVSVPTASSQLIDPGPSTLLYLQPFGGFIINRGDFFVQGFTSLILPIARPESIVLFTDVGAGYWLYRDPSASGLLTGVAPTVEVHVSTPLRQANPNVDLFGIFDRLRLHDVVDFTAGVTFELSGRSTLGLGVAVPVTGPKLFEVEGLAQLNWRF
jgi:hypothetical protein